jgi:hypothetical protein
MDFCGIFQTENSFSLNLYSDFSIFYSIMQRFHQFFSTIIFTIYFWPLKMVKTFFFALKQTAIVIKSEALSLKNCLQTLFF